MSDKSSVLPSPDSVCGDYTLGRLLSSNIIGGVYEATYKNKKVIVHALYKAFVEIDPYFLKKLKTIHERLKKVSGENIHISEKIEKVENYYFLHYNLNGLVSFSEMIDLAWKDSNSLEEGWVRGVLGQIGNVLKAVRVLEVGHQFLTPELIFLDKKGKVVILGLGVLESIEYSKFEEFISKSINPIKDSRNQSLTPLEILSPELRDRKMMDTRGDFYGLGILAYLLLTGEKPVRNWTLPSKTRDGILQSWDLLISHCLEPDPNNRYATWNAFLKDLNNLENLKAGTETKERGKLRTLDWIPLPNSIESRFSGKTLTAIRLSLLGLVGLFAIGAASILLMIIFEDPPEDNVRQVVRRLSGPEGANFAFFINPSQAKITVRAHGRSTFVINNGEIYFSGTPRSYEFRIQSPLHSPKVFKIPLEKQTQVFERVINLEIPWIRVNIEGIAGTEIYVASKDKDYFVDEIGDSGVVELEHRFVEGNYKIVARKEGFYDQDLGELSFAEGENEMIQLEQVAKPAGLVLNGNQTDAEVFIDGQKVGLLPLKIGSIEPYQSLAIEVRKMGHRSFLETIDFEPGKVVSIDVPELDRKKATVNLEVKNFDLDLSAIDAINISIGKINLKGILSHSIDVATGEQVLSVNHPDYFPFSQNLSLEDKSTQKLIVKLKPKPASVQLDIDSENPFRVVRNGEQLSPNQSVVELTPGKPAEISVQVRDYLTVKKRFRLGPNKTESWAVPLKEIPGPEKQSEWDPPYFTLPMVWVDGGSYRMGSSYDEVRRLPNEDSKTTIRITNGFWVGKYEVTQHLYHQLMRSNPSSFKGDEKPVESISWNEAVEFTKRLTAFERRAGRLPENYEYRLPTEAEWEFFARAGTESVYHFGNTAEPSMGNFQGKYPEVNQSISSDIYGTTEVGSYLPNGFGIYDVHGNVAEWVYDKYWDRLPGGIKTDYVNFDEGRGRAIRGGSWQDSAHRVRIAARAGVKESSQRDSVGFRVVLAPKID